MFKSLSDIGKKLQIIEPYQLLFNKQQLLNNTINDYFSFQYTHN